MLLCKPHAHWTSICFSVPGSEKSPILLKYSLFSAQISGFSADFHRKSLDILKQHPNNAAIWADGVFWPSNQVVTLVNISSIGTVHKNRDLENGKKSGFWRSKK